MIPMMFSAFLLVSDAAAAAPAPVPTAPAAVEAPKQERKICKRESSATSLYGSKRVCMTAAQWKARDLNVSLEDMGGVTTK